ncbi:MAG: FN3 associated domain-containing protein [Spirochaetota bacterium]
MKKKLVYCIILLLLYCEKEAAKNQFLFVPLAIVGTQELLQDKVLFSLQEGVYYGPQSLQLHTGEGKQNIYYKISKQTADSQIDRESPYTLYKGSIPLEFAANSIYTVYAYVGARTQNIQTKSYVIRDTVSSPVVSPSLQQQFLNTPISISCTTRNAHIRYAFAEEKLSSTEGKLYQGEEIVLTQDTKIRALAYIPGHPSQVSPIVERQYTVMRDVPKPRLLPLPGVYKQPLVLQFVPENPGRQIRYTTDGTDPTNMHGVLLDKQNDDWSLLVTETTTIKAVLIYRDKISEILEASYSIERPEPPNFSHKAGVYDTPFLLQLLQEETEEIWYTTNGSLPGKGKGQLYTVPIEIRDNRQVQAIRCYREYSHCSSIVTQSYTIQSQIPPPVLSPPPGDYTEFPEIVFKEEAESGEVYYSLDGSDPKQGTLYQREAIPISQNTTVRAVRINSLGEVSEELNATYKIHSFHSTNLAELYGLANIMYSQRAGGGLQKEVLRAQKLVLDAPQLIRDTTRRQKFMQQDPVVAASELCTTIVRYLYLYSYQKIYPEHIRALPTFAEFYIYGVDKGYIITDSGGVTYNWVANGAALLTDFMQLDFVGEWERRRGASGYQTDALLLEYAQMRQPSIFFLRDGATSVGGTHTFLALYEKGVGYRMLDTFHHAWTGKDFFEDAHSNSPYRVRFGSEGTRWLHLIYAYAKY